MFGRQDGRRAAMGAAISTLALAVPVAGAVACGRVLERFVTVDAGVR